MRDELLFCLFNFFDLLVINRRRGILKSLISSGSNPSTHFHVKTPGTQNVGILKLLTSLITFRHFHNEKREDTLKSFRSSGRMDEESSIRVFSLSFELNAQLTMLEKSCKGGCLLNTGNKTVRVV